MWMETVLDDLFDGGMIRVVDKEGWAYEGEFCGIRHKQREVCLRVPRGMFPAGSLGDDMVQFFKTCNVLKYERLVCEGV